MVLRLMEVYLPKAKADRVADLLEDATPMGLWRESLEGDQILVKILIPAEDAEALIDRLEQNFRGVEGFRVVLLAVEATYPLPPEPPPGEPEAPELAPSRFRRISRQELQNDIASSTDLSLTYLLLVVLSAIVAAVGIYRNDVAIIIGAMVIAPLLGPNVALALATTLGDFALARKALIMNLAGIFLAVLVAILIGLAFPVSPDFPQIASRTRVGLGDIALATAAGGAGVLAFTTGVPAILVGVMVAVALLPPMVAFGLLIGSGHYGLAVAALLLVLVYLIGVNLSAVAAFIAQGIRPRTWWEAKRATRASRVSIVVWTVLLVVLAVLILISPRG